MQQSLQAIRGYSLRAEGREFGEVVDFLVDSQTWSVRYLVAKTRRLLPGREVAIAVSEAAAPDWRRLHVPLALNKTEVKRSLGATQAERGARPQVRVIGPAEAVAEAAAQNRDDDHLHRFGALKDIHLISTTEGSLGRVVDLLVDDQTWAIRSLVIELDCLGRRRVTVGVEWIDEMAGSGRIYITRLGTAAVAAVSAGVVFAIIGNDTDDRPFDALYDQDGRSRTWIR